MSPVARNFRWLAVILPLLAVSLSACVIAPYPGHVVYWDHGRSYWR
jgi:hypothetical protein